ncbi:MAG: hypothetical protein AAGH78_01835 [Cyanobacteria bacterium P01_H01_bin.58]
MKVERFNTKPLSKEELSHLKKLRNFIEKALEDGHLSIYESEHLQSLVWAKGKVTYEELRIISETVYKMVGDIFIDLEWRTVD